VSFFLLEGLFWDIADHWVLVLPDNIECTVPFEDSDSLDFDLDEEQVR
jgi:hypothetical protein